MDVLEKLDSPGSLCPLLVSSFSPPEDYAESSKVMRHRGRHASPLQEPPLPLLDSDGLLTIPDILGSQLHSLSLCLCCHMMSSLCVFTSSSLCVCLS